MDSPIDIYCPPQSMSIFVITSFIWRKNLVSKNFSNSLVKKMRLLQIEQVPSTGDDRKGRAGDSSLHIHLQLKAESADLRRHE